MKLQQGNIFRSVCQEVCPQGEGVSASVHAGIHTSPWAETLRPQQTATAVDGTHPTGMHYGGF